MVILLSETAHCYSLMCPQPVGQLRICHYGNPKWAASVINNNVDHQLATLPSAHSKSGFWRSQRLTIVIHYEVTLPFFVPRSLQIEQYLTDNYILLTTGDSSLPLTRMLLVSRYTRKCRKQETMRPLCLFVLYFQGFHMSDGEMWAIGRENIPVADFSKFQNTSYLSGFWRRTFFLLHTSKVWKMAYRDISSASGS